MITIFNGRKRTLGGGTEEVWAQVDVGFRDRLQLFKGARLGVFLAISLHANEEGWAWPSYDLLAKETGYNRNTVSEALAELCKLEIEGQRVLLRYQPQAEQGGQFASNRYLIFPSPADVAKHEGAGVSHLGADARRVTETGTDLPCTENPYTGKPYTENPYTNKNHLKAEPVSTTTASSRGRKKRASLHQVKAQDQLSPEQVTALELLATLPGMDPAQAARIVKSCNLPDVAPWVAECRQAPPEVAAKLAIARLRDRIPPPAGRAGNGGEQDPRRFLAEGTEFEGLIEH